MLLAAVLTQNPEMPSSQSPPAKTERSQKVSKQRSPLELPAHCSADEARASSPCLHPFKAPAEQRGMCEGALRLLQMAARGRCRTRGYLRGVRAKSTAFPHLHPQPFTRLFSLRDGVAVWGAGSLGACEFPVQLRGCRWQSGGEVGVAAQRWQCTLGTWKEPSHSW